MIFNWLLHCFVLSYCISCSYCNRCHNGGTPLLGYHCLCPTEYKGNTCQTPKCYYGLPVNSSGASEKRGAISDLCACDINWQGRLCDQIQCVYGTPDYARKRCDCRSQYEGQHCNKIKAGECLKGRRSYETYRCICEEGWEGEFCDLITCYNNKRRLSDTECDCQIGFIQPHCEKLDKWTITDWLMIAVYVMMALVIGAMFYVIITKCIVTFCKEP